MKKKLMMISMVFVFILNGSTSGYSQCSICTKTASQLGEKPAKGMNSGILYLMFAPLAIAGYVGYRWWQREKMVIEDERAQNP